MSIACRKPGLRGAIVLSRQPPPAGAAPPLKHLLPALGGGARAKAVAPLADELAGLIGAFHDVFSVFGSFLKSRPWPIHLIRAAGLTGATCGNSLPFNELREGL
jgi:hypothetical protein